MVRLYKLASGLLDQTMQKRAETTVIFARLVFETCVNVRYLVAHFSPELVDSYVRHSLRHERKVLDTIQQSVASRGGTYLPIEDRMLRSLARAERLAGVALSSVDLTDRAPWGGKNLYVLVSARLRWRMIAVAAINSRLRQLVRTRLGVLAPAGPWASDFSIIFGHSSSPCLKPQPFTVRAAPAGRQSN